jgi:protein involved in polysaccharide export with SLBB domain
LGAGDVLSMRLYDQPGTIKQVIIGPDGRLNYLQVTDFEATGLTVDELRGKLEQALAKFYLAPALIISPVSLNSKRFFLLGSVRQKGVFSLSKPVTIVEAIARAGGFEGANNFVAADFARSFLVRTDGKQDFRRMPVDFEALFLRGDFNQNLALAPDDYLFLAPLNIKEVYVLGDVAGAGAIPFTQEITVLQAIATRGGFTSRAFRQKVLVIRGSLQQPSTEVVNTATILAGKAPDYPLKPGDIVYVSRKPWSYAQDLLELAINSYIQSLVIGWTGQNVGRIASDPYVPNLND